MSVVITGFTQTSVNPFTDISGSNYYAGFTGVPAGSYYYNSGNLYIFQLVVANNIATGSITIPSNATVKYYLVGGGGGGAQYGNANGNGGGGGGGYLSNQIITSGVTTLNISIGAGGGGANNIVNATAGGTTSLIYLGNTTSANGGLAGTLVSPVASYGSRFIDSLGNIYYYGSGGGININSAFSGGRGGNGYNHLGGVGGGGVTFSGGGGGGGGGTNGDGGAGSNSSSGGTGGTGGAGGGGAGGDGTSVGSGSPGIPGSIGCGGGGGGGGSGGGSGGGAGGAGGVGGGGGGGGSGSSAGVGGAGGINGGGGGAGGGGGGIGGNGGIGLIVLEIILIPPPQSIPQLSAESYYYNPVPTRVWSRVQAPCTYTDPGSTYETAFIPVLNQTLPLSQAIALGQNLYKGNILQYKANSSRITKKQKYAQLAKGLWCNRTKVFATQSTTYTNPNTTGLMRVNYTTLPYPNQIVGQPNNISGPFQYNVPSPDGCPTTSVQEGGNLVCGTFVNPCTGQVIQKIPQPSLICNSSTASDVPGIPVDLCWTPKVQTFFPRNNLTNSNSLDKWPEGYKGLVSAITPSAPVLSLVSTTNSSVTLSWIYNFNQCIPISSFNIYQDGILVKTVPYPLLSTTIYGLTDCNMYKFYATCLSNTTPSSPSNTVDVYLVYPLAPTITSGIIVNETITINWTPNLNCAPISNYLIYENGVLLATVSSNTFSYTVNNIIDCDIYSFYIISYDQIDNTYSEQSNTITSDVIPLAPTNLSGVAISLTGIDLSWNQPVCCAPVNGGYIYYSTTNTPPFSLRQFVSYNSPSTNNGFRFNNLQNNITYYFYMVTTSNNTSSLPSTPILSVATPVLVAPVITDASAASLNSITVKWSYTYTSIQQVTSWNIYYSTSSTGPFSLQSFSNSPTITSATLINLTNNTSYYIYMVAYNSTYNVYSGNSNNPPSSPILIPLLVKPTNVSATSTSFTQITVTWSWTSPSSPSQSVTGFYLFWAPAGSTSFNQIDVGNTLTYALGGLTNLTYYNIYVEAYNTNYVPTIVSLPSTPTYSYQLNYNSFWYLTGNPLILTTNYNIQASAIYVATSGITYSGQPSAPWSLNGSTLTSYNNLPIYVSSVNATSSTPQTSAPNSWYYTTNQTPAGLYTPYPIAITNFTPS
jgi:hypothetical protein